MNIVRCKVDGCNSQFQTAGAVAADVSYICKNHSRAVQVRAAGRQYDVVKDNSDAEVQFQDHQFDKDLRRAAKPVNTDHIKRQGSETNDQPEGR